MNKEEIIIGIKKIKFMSRTYDHQLGELINNHESQWPVFDRIYKEAIERNALPHVWEEYHSNIQDNVKLVIDMEFLPPEVSAETRMAIKADYDRLAAIKASHRAIAGIIDDHAARLEQAIADLEQPIPEPEKQTPSWGYILMGASIGFVVAVLSM